MVALNACLILTLNAANPASVVSRPGISDEQIARLGFHEHVVPVDGGRIDWTRGHILVDGIGRAKSTSPQHRLMAQRAAELVAARNALALARGIRIDADGRIESIRGGSVHVEGVIRGHQVTETSWLSGARPPQARVTLRVPLWGIDGVAALFWRTRQVQSRYARERITLPDPQEGSTTTILVIDARGLEVSECLFPAIVDPRGRVLYDLATLPARTAHTLPCVRYVTSDKAFELPKTRSADTPSAESQVEMLTIRATRASGPQQTELVISADDADRLARSFETVAALRQARVLILVDRTDQVP